MKLNYSMGIDREFWSGFTLGGLLAGIISFITGLGIADLLAFIAALAIPVIPVFAMWVYFRYY